MYTKQITAAHVDGTMSKKERERIVSEYRQGKITVVSNVDLFGVGFDDKDIEVTILLRPTQSLALAVQQNMRCMRMANFMRDQMLAIVRIAKSLTITITHPLWQSLM